MRIGLVPGDHEGDVTLDTFIEDLEAILDGLPMLILILKMARAQARRELTEAGEEDLLLLGDRYGAREPALERREAEG